MFGISKQKIENKCGIDLIEYGEHQYLTFSFHEAKNYGFQRYASSSVDALIYALRKYEKLPLAATT